ncbi:TetR family transcriptional regulator [Agromyces archimandritae]|uniref:TetR family transcriptional regulator n=1 Tax=Agromyces archimandritae TaxID=2781962 RepID=A0A975FN10_9MICO|nr:TetR family transcriptional regulator [Agromyces archimandritae]QTX04682.1 TetR family transcriptional regulator [Agromyces archimandritae]
MTNPPAPGRPRASSRRDLEDAAAELFLEQGYARTTIGDIARRAGVGRNTFFNYFDAKSDLLWLDFDETAAALPDALDAAPADLDPMPALAAAVRELAARHPATAVPIALSQHESMDTLEEFRAAGLERFVRLAGSFAGFLAARIGRSPRELDIAAAASALAAAIAAGAGAWALAGVGRGPLTAYLDRAVAPVVAGYGPAIR